MLKASRPKVDQLVVGGVLPIPSCLLRAKIGKSLAEKDLKVDQAKAVMAKVTVPLPTDVVCAKEFSATATATAKELPTTWLMTT